MTNSPSAATGSQPLRYIAGPRMAARLRRDGWSVDHFDLMLGASGGPKWLALYGIDTVLAPLLAGRRAPLSMLGSSIGAWRQACYAQANPVAALGRFRDAYLEPPDHDGPLDFNVLFARCLERVLRVTGAAEVAANRHLIQHIVTARRVRPTGSLVRGFAGPVTRNLVARRWLGSRNFQRSVFSTVPDDLERLAGPGWHVGHRVALNAGNVASALLATAAIPGLLRPVAVDGDTARHWDGGIFDYHFHPGELRAELAIVYPHFYPHLVAGWFDRFARRRVPAAALDNTLLITPSAAFVASLPYAKIPDRRDGRRLEPEQLQRYWRTVLERSEALGEVFAEQIVGGAFVALLESP